MLRLYQSCLFKNVRNSVKISIKVHNKSDSAIMKCLSVAEKNDAAKNIARILSRGNLRMREGLSRFNKIYEFPCQLRNEDTTMSMTSVAGHLMKFEFDIQYKTWHTANPIELFDAPLHKECPQDYTKIKQTLEREVRYCSILIIWTDCDREGENIGKEIIDVCRAVKSSIRVYRAKFSEITAASIWRAFENLAEIDEKVCDAVDVRSEMDLRTGAAFTRLQTLRYQNAFPGILNKNLISYGSCQFPTLGFVVERYKAIEEFIPEMFWYIHMAHNKKGIITTFKWNANRLFDKPAVLALLDLCISEQRATVINVTNRPKSKWRPLPLDTVELEKNISRKLKINAKEVMKVAEKLYTQGYISYPRTETNIFPASMDLKPLVEMHQQDAQWGAFASRILSDGGPRPRQGKKSDQAHPPIHPLKYSDSLSGNEKKVYEYIVRHFLACVSKDAIGHETIVVAKMGIEGFTATGLVVLERNYLEVYIYETWTGKQIAEYEEGDEFVPSSLELGEGTTSPPKLLTEADLIALMEKHGIGTDATHADHIETIKAREYVTLQNNMYFVPSALGMGMVEGYNEMISEFSLARPNLRAEFERDLRLICSGEKRAADVLRDQIAKYRAAFETVSANISVMDSVLSHRLRAPIQNVPNVSQLPSRPRNVLKCPKCGSWMSLRKVKDADKWYVGCNQFPVCRNSAWFPQSVTQAEVLDSDCPHCESVKQLKCTFSHILFYGEPNPMTLCIGGCDDNVLTMFNVPLSTVKTTTSNNSMSSWMNNNSRTDSFNNSTNLNRTNANFRQDIANSSTAMNNSLNSQTSSTDNVVLCNCGQASVVRTVVKSEANRGRKYHNCAKPMSEKCNFFKWANDNAVSVNDTNASFARPNAAPRRRKKNNSNTTVNAPSRRSRTGTGAARKCSQCGVEGHTKRRCPNGNND